MRSETVSPEAAFIHSLQAEERPTEQKPDLVAYFGKRESIESLMDRELASLADKLLKLVPEGLEDIVESLYEECFANWLIQLRRQYSNGWCSRGKFREHELDECGLEDFDDAGRKFVKLQRAWRGIVQFNYKWIEEGPWYEVQFGLPGWEDQIKD